MIPEVIKDTKSSLLGLHNLKCMWVAQGSPYVPKFKMLAFWNELKGVKNHPVINAGDAEDT